MTTQDRASGPDAWPSLRFEEWQPACNTVHLWTQVVGKVRLALTPLVNHWWNVPFYVTARGLTTSAMPSQNRLLQIDFDFIDHRLILATSDGRADEFALSPQPVADFYAEVMGRLRALGIDVAIWTMPVEIEGAIPFEDDREHASYDAEAMHRFGRQLVAVDRVFKIFRARFIGKCSPVHFFWGSFDLAVSRFSGRSAPKLTSHTPHVADWVMQEAYSHECSSCGFWPGNGGFGQAAFFAYAYPQPEGFADEPVRPAAAAYNADVGQFILPYDAVRKAPSPEEALLDFMQSTYDAGADLAQWKRDELERRP